MREVVDGVMAEAPRVLVVGGTGAVGKHVCHEVVRTLGADALVVGDHNAERGAAFAGALDRRVRSCRVDVHNRESIAHALDQLDGGDAVIVTVRQATPMVQDLCTARGIHSVDIVPDTPLMRSERGALCGVGAAGFIPGLSGLMAKAAIEQACRDGALPGDLTVHVALLQRKDGTAGATGIADMLGLFATPVEYEGRQVRGFTRTRVAPFPHPFGDRVVRLAAFPEAADVQRCFGVAHAYYWTAFDHESSTGQYPPPTGWESSSAFRSPAVDGASPPSLRAEKAPNRGWKNGWRSRRRHTTPSFAWRYLPTTPAPLWRRWPWRVSCPPGDASTMAWYFPSSSFLWSRLWHASVRLWCGQIFDLPAIAARVLSQYDPSSNPGPGVNA